MLFEDKKMESQVYHQINQLLRGHTQRDHPTKRGSPNPPVFRFSHIKNQRGKVQ